MPDSHTLSGLIKVMCDATTKVKRGKTVQQLAPSQIRVPLKASKNGETFWGEDWSGTLSFKSTKNGLIKMERITGEGKGVRGKETNVHAVQAFSVVSI